MIVFLLTIVGALNWGLVGIGMFMGSDLNVVHMILGGSATLESLVYVLVGISGIVLMVGHKKDCRMCGVGM